MAELVDVSNFQDGLDLAAVKAAGRAGVFCKASEGVDFADKTYAGFRTAAAANGLLFGAYHFARPDTNTSTSDARAITSDAKREAQWFLAAAAPAAGDMVAVDVEKISPLSPVQMELWLATWLAEVEDALNQRPLLYTNPGYWQSALGGSKDFGAYPLWQAEWGANDGARHTPTVIPGWTEIAIHQYTSKGTISGWSGSLDLDFIDPAYEYTQLQIGQQPTVVGPPYGPPYTLLAGDGSTIATTAQRSQTFTDGVYNELGARGKVTLAATRRTA